MANPTIDVYVDVHPVGVDPKGTFDAKYVKSLPDKVTAAAKKAFEGKKRTILVKKVKTDLLFTVGKAPAGKGKQYGYDSNVNTISKEPDGNNFKIGAKAASSVGVGSSTSMFAFSPSSAKVPGVPDKQVDGAVLDVAIAVIEDGINKRLVDAIADHVEKNP